MPNIIHILNTKTNVIFENPGKDLVAYAKAAPEDFKFVYDDEPEVEKDVVYTEDNLKAMSMKDLQVIAEALEVECDKRRKDSLIDGILKHRG